MADDESWEKSRDFLLSWFKRIIKFPLFIPKTIDFLHIPIPIVRNRLSNRLFCKSTLWITLGNSAEPSAMFNSIYLIFRMYSLSGSYILRWYLFLCTLEAIFVGYFCFLHSAQSISCVDWLRLRLHRSTWSTVFTELIHGYYPVYATWAHVYAQDLAWPLTMWLLACPRALTLAQQLNYQETILLNINV